MAGDQKWKPERVNPVFLPEPVSPSGSEGAVRKRIRSRSRRYLPPAYAWVKIMAWLCITFFVLVVLVTVFNWITKDGWRLLDALPFIGFFALMFLIPPVGVLLKQKWGFYLALVANIPLLLAFPIGSVIGFITIRALLESKDVFGIR